MQNSQLSAGYALDTSLATGRNYHKPHNKLFKSKRRPYNFKQYLNAYGKLLRLQGGEHE